MSGFSGNSQGVIRGNPLGDPQQKRRGEEERRGEEKSRRSFGSSREIRLLAASGSANAAISKNDRFYIPLLFDTMN
jgi:hypothetical protein